MGISLSLFFIAAGAILAWAVSADVSGVNIQAVGVILLIVGILGFLLSLVFWSSWGGFGGWARNGGAGAGSAGTASPQTTIIKDDNP
jgi:hypothetical protein